jgi:hypothetical protein
VEPPNADVSEPPNAGVSETPNADISEQTCVISSFCYGVNEICTLLDFYTA